MDIDNHIPIANYIFVTITAGVLAYVTVMSEDVDKSYEMPPEYADRDEDEEIPDTPETSIDTTNNTESADDNNGYVSSFGAGISGFFAGLGATNKENTQEPEKEQSPIEDDKDDEILLDSLENKEDSEKQDEDKEKEERDNNNDERLQETQENKEDGVENSPSKQLQDIQELGSIEKVDTVSKKNEDSLDVIEKKPITGGTKHNKSSKKTKSNMKRKTSSNKKRKTNGQK